MRRTCEQDIFSLLVITCDYTNVRDPPKLVTSRSFPFCHKGCLGIISAPATK